LSGLHHAIDGWTVLSLTKSRSLEEIEDDYWGDPPADATGDQHCVRAAQTADRHARRRGPAPAHLAADRVLETLVPLRSTTSRRDPLAEGDFYPGDLLDALMRRVPSPIGRHTGISGLACRTAAEALDPAETFDLLYARAAEFLGR